MPRAGRWAISLVDDPGAAEITRDGEKEAAERVPAMTDGFSARRLPRAQ